MQFVQKKGNFVKALPSMTVRKQRDAKIYDHSKNYRLNLQNFAWFRTSVGPCTFATVHFSAFH